jgi:hypothetical protein
MEFRIQSLPTSLYEREEKVPPFIKGGEGDFYVTIFMKFGT